MRPSSCKAKGRRLQQIVVALIRETWPDLEDDDVRSCAMGSGGEDVQMSPAARRVFPFSVECKNTERGAALVWSAMQQACANCRGNAPCVVIKRNHEQPLCVVRLSDFMRLAEAASRVIGESTVDGMEAQDGGQDAASATEPLGSANQVAAELRRLASILDEFPAALQ